jgi:hypothetical protein
VAGIYKIMPDHLSGDRDIALYAVSQDCNNFVHLPELLRGSGDIVNAVIDAHGKAKGQRGHFVPFDEKKRNGRFFGFASAELRGDSEVALKAVRLDGILLEHVIFEGGRRDKEVIIAAVGENASSWLLVPRLLQEDIDVVMGAARANFGSVSRMPSTARNNPEVIASAIRGAGVSQIMLQFMMLETDVRRKLQEFSEKYPTEEDISGEIVMLDETVDRKLWASERKHALWENMWLVECIISGANIGAVSLPRDVKTHILLFADIPSDLRRVKHTVEVGPVVQALAEKNLPLATLLPFLGLA